MKYHYSAKAQAGIPQAAPLADQPTVQCAMPQWHDAHGYDDIDCPEAVPAGSGWCPGVTFESIKVLLKDD